MKTESAAATRSVSVQTSKGFDLRLGYIVAEKADQKPHNKGVKETSEVFSTISPDHLNAYAA